MKKMLSILAAAGLVASASTTIACGNSSSSSTGVLNLDNVKFTSAALNYGYFSNVNDGNDLKGRVLTVYGEHLTNIQNFLNKDKKFRIVNSAGDLVEGSEKFTWLDRDKIKNGESTDGVAYIYLMDPITSPGTYTFEYYDKDKQNPDLSTTFVIPKENPFFVRVNVDEDDKTLSIDGENLYLVNAADLSISTKPSGYDPDNNDASSQKITFTKKSANKKDNGLDELVVEASQKLESGKEYTIEWDPEGQESKTLPDFVVGEVNKKYSLSKIAGYDDGSIMRVTKDISRVDLYVQGDKDAGGHDLWQQFTINGKQAISAQDSFGLIGIKFFNGDLKEGQDVTIEFTNADGTRLTQKFTYSPVD